ncbi:isoprenyl transferase [Sedimentibacter sp. zth1]|uniref:isoprenyl transferase n=1 Tax=Sedimentibacter sp. zth1 TaxID=2816908 RepID=UPI001A934637|nr:isoprenyl transferase [Sedimentibacter sp. zth1]QSX06554.1 isoprenyl transferase [Sedimentibacter sp. zth1]
MNLKDEILEGIVPQHVAIIMDGNRRWAKTRKLPTAMGHREGVKRIMEIVESSINIGVKALTVYAFSTENWGRDKVEVDCLMNLLLEFLKKELDRIHKNNIKISLIGNIEDLPFDIKIEVQKALEKTKYNNRFNLNIALSYGSRDEIIKAVKKVINDVENNKINIDDLNEKKFKDYLYTKDFDDPDFLIRTSGEIRLSNFLLYQLAYTEFYFTDIFWPDFKENEYYESILEYQKRSRRFGKK